MAITSGKARFLELRGISSPILLAPWQAVGTPLEQPVRILKISNATDQDIVISTDGVTEMDFIAANGFALYDLGTNRSESGATFQFPEQTQFYVRAATVATTTGDVLITGIFAGV
jgi:hypothetical protein